tara:strand:+ start:333 stop:917 length:585 start_codon:yes stop_codon:yes gene_type:complete
MRRLFIIAASFLIPTTAFAHTGAMGHDLAHGFAHPLGGLDHVLAMVAVGTLAATLGGRASWALPLSFVTMMVAGFALGMLQLNLPLAEFAIVLSVIAIGGAIAWAGPLSLAAAMALVGAFAVFHGYAHGMEAPVSASALPYISGFVAATALLHAAGLAGTLALLRLSKRHGHAIGRITGGAFVLGGLGLLLGWL